MIVATNQKGFLINSCSPKGERIIVWFGRKDGLYYKMHIFPASGEVTLVTFGSADKLVDQLPFAESWLLEGVKDHEIESVIKAQISKV